MPAMKNIAGNFFLVGLPGAGKSTLGKMLAEYLAYEFIDADQFLVEQVGADIPTIFALEGEGGFRQREEKIIDALTQRKNIVLATGGGAVLSANNRRYLQSRGQVIYLYAQPNLLYEHTRMDKGRPLLQVDDPLEKLHQLYDARHPLYQQIADYTFQVEPNKSAHQLLQNLIHLLET